MFDENLFKAIRASIPSPEDVRARRERAYSWTDQLISGDDILSRAPGAAPARFNLLSLPAWLAIAARAGVPAISARPLAELDAEQFVASFDHRNTQASATYDAFYEKLLAGLQDGEMIRMEQVAPREIKGLMSDGAEMTNGLFAAIDGEMYLDLHEDRYLSTFTDLGARRVRAYARPIVAARKIRGTFKGKDAAWATEARVYIEDGKIVGISNYYSQVAMTPADHAPFLAAAKHAAETMLQTMAGLHLGVGNHALCADAGEGSEVFQTRDVGRPEWMPETWADQDFTLDFLLSEAGETLFLEGGPAGMRASHPCCFLQDGRAASADFLHGVAYSETAPIEALSSLD